MSNGPAGGLPPLAVADRLDALRALLDDAGVDALLVTGTTNVRYLTGFTGSAGSLWVDGWRAVLITDGRYADQAPAQVTGAGAEVDVEIVGSSDQSPSPPWPRGRPGSAWRPGRSRGLNSGA